MQDADQDIYELNLSWLFKARELAKSNHKKAAIVLGFDEGVAEGISRLSIEDLQDIARSGIMLFQPRFHPKFWKEMIKGGRGPSLAVKLQGLLMAAGGTTDP